MRRQPSTQTRKELEELAHPILRSKVSSIILALQQTRPVMTGVAHTKEQAQCILLSYDTQCLIWGDVAMTIGRAIRDDTPNFSLAKFMDECNKGI